VTRYRTIVADPPWRYRSTDILTRGWQRTASVESGKTAEGHYTTMTNAEIAALAVGDMADDPACLFLWVTNPRLYGERDGSCSPFEIAQGWGFRYVTMLTWVKTGPMGLGFYFRGQTEHVLFCVRGDFKIPAALRESNIITAPRRRHSEKPDAFYDKVERVCPEPRVELFARRARLGGWDYWGDQSLGTAEMAG
jgi:N6-adenosine-specific RNA methylase IME4